LKEKKNWDEKREKGKNTWTGLVNLATTTIVNIGEEREEEGVDGQV